MIYALVAYGVTVVLWALWAVAVNARERQLRK
jgi:hypothetical protein